MKRGSRGSNSIGGRAGDWLRWKSFHIRQSTGRLLVADLHRDPARSIHLASWQRSGSTWLAEILSSAPSTRLIYEPANIRQRFFLKGEPRLVSLPHAAPGDELGDDAKMIDRAFTGSLQSTWANQLNASHRPIRRVVKDVRTIPILPWLVDAYPEVPVIVLLRHPMAVAHSLIDLGWSLNADALADPNLDRRDPELVAALRSQTVAQEVALWASHHSWALGHPASSSVHVVFYESLRADPDGELGRIEAFLKGFHPVWADWKPNAASIKRPSWTSFAKDGSSSTPRGEAWAEVYGSETLAEATRILAAHGLDGLYGSGRDPLVTGDEAITTVRSAIARLDGNL